MASGAAAVTVCVTMVGCKSTIYNFLPLNKIPNSNKITCDLRLWEQLSLTPILIAGSIVILCRNPTLNPGDFFDRSFEEYKNGFANHGICRNTYMTVFQNDSLTGEGWLGLEKLHQITSKKLYRLKVTLTARNWTQYVGYYDWMKVRNANLTIRFWGLEIGVSISNI